MRIIRLLPFVAVLIGASTLRAQAPQSFSYQAVLRDPLSGQPMAGTTATARYVLRAGVPLGVVVFEETQPLSTNDQGLFTAQVGNGTPVSGSFSGINWRSGPYFLEVSLDVGNTGSFTSMGTQQLLSVPYALHAGSSSDVPDATEPGQIMHWDGGAWVADSGLYVYQKRLGIGDTQPESPLSIKSREYLYQEFKNGDIPNENDFHISSGSGTGLSFDQDTTGGTASRLYLQGGTGHVGIGTQDPPAPLAIVSRAVLKQYFQSGDSPTQSQFGFSSTDTTGFGIDQGIPGSMTSRFFIEQSTGNVGIGTTAPVARVHIRGESEGMASVLYAICNGNALTNGGWGFGHVHDPSGENDGSFTLLESPLDPGAGGGGSGGQLRVVVRAGGNVGINEEIPDTKLHVSRSLSDPSCALDLLEGTGILTLGPMTDNIVLDYRGIQARQILAGTTTIQGSPLSLQRMGGDILIHGDATIPDDHRVTITSDGNLGLGKSPTERLDVNGAITLGDASSTTPPNGTIRWSGTDFEGRSSGEWVPFDAGWRRVISSNDVHHNSRVGIGTSAPDVALHVSRPPADPEASVALAENTGIAVIGPMTNNVTMDFRGLQARHGEFIGDVLNITATTLNLQRLGGDILIHGDVTIPDDHRVTVTSEGHLGLGKSPTERLDVNGAITLGDASSTTPPNGTIRWSGTDFEGRSSGEWVPFDAGWRRVISSNDVHHNSRVGIGTSTIDSYLHLVDDGVTSFDRKAAIIQNHASTTSTGAEDNRVGLLIENTGAWGGSAQSKDVGLYVSQVSGQSSAHTNLAAVLNGNTVIGDLHPSSSLIGTNGVNVLAIQNGSAPAAPPSSSSGLPDAGVQLYSASGTDGVSTLHVMRGNGDVVKLYTAPAITTADGSPIGPGVDPNTAALIENMRTRINELEARLQAHGLLANP